jgi:indolepyruvate ferredoxin oxidoreductase, beta subunit
MSVEDVIRVAELKLRQARLQRVRGEAGAAAGDIVDISEYMRPGVEELCGLLPPRIGRWTLRHVRGDRAWAMKLRSTRFSGFVRLRLLAALRRWRRRTLRFAEEETFTAHWLRLVDRTLGVCPEAAQEVVATAGLVRGYADTYRRGLANWHSIAVDVVEPMLAGRLPVAQFATAVLQARIAANKDPEGAALGATIAALQRLAVEGAQSPGTAAAPG